METIVRKPHKQETILVLGVRLPFRLVVRDLELLQWRCICVDFASQERLMLLLFPPLRLTLLDTLNNTLAITQFMHACPKHF